MKITTTFLLLPFLFFTKTPLYAQSFDVVNIGDTTGIGFTNFEPDSYGYDFIAPLKSPLLCKRSHQVAFDSLYLNDTIPAGEYVGNITTTGTVVAPDSVWLWAPDSIDLVDNFLVETGSFFNAAIFTDSDFCTDPNEYSPAHTNRYFMSFFGPRMRASSGNILALYDYHRGTDVIDQAVPNSDFPDLYCICDGVVDRVFDENDLDPGEDIENTSTGRYVTVKCDSVFNGNPSWGHIHAATRHMSEIDPNLTEGDSVRRGQVLGKLGASGYTSTPHLHFSVQRRNTMNHLINVHPMRIYNPHCNPHLMQFVDGVPFDPDPSQHHLESVQIELLDYDSSHAMPTDNHATVRVTIPYNKAQIRAIKVKNQSYENYIDFEEISEVRDGNTPWLDDPILNDSLTLFVFPFNRGLSAYNRFASIETDLMNYTHTGNDFPIPNSGIYQTPALTLDLKLTHLPMGFTAADFVVEVLDIWGHGVRGSF
jgi:murein DD-endopeptidase MepM/ murein hydrolase activator NlpD